MKRKPGNSFLNSLLITFFFNLTQYALFFVWYHRSFFYPCFNDSFSGDFRYCWQAKDEKLTAVCVDFGPLWTFIIFRSRTGEVRKPCDILPPFTGPERKYGYNENTMSSSSVGLSVVYMLFVVIASVLECCCLYIVWKFYFQLDMYLS